MDDLGNRVKRYEQASRYWLSPRQPVMIRVDGRAFHTFTRRMDRPFDQDLMDVMEYATRQTAKDMMGFKLAYTQSDEATFLITDYDRLTSQGWFDYELNKVVSLSASLFTAHFHQEIEKFIVCRGMRVGNMATFDSRAFTVPADDVPNVFVWRQRDWERNSLAMLAQANFSHKQLIGKKRQDMHDILHEIGVNWADLSPREKNGTFILRDGSTRQEKADYTMIADWILQSGEE